VPDADRSRKADKTLNNENCGHRSASARSTRWLRPFIPPDGTHYGSQCKQTDNNQEEDEGQEEKERTSHFGKHDDSPPSVPPPVLFQLF
jgi:hypothetical protein